MKKLLAMMLVGVICFSLVACGDSGTYKKAQDAFEQLEYEQVIELLDAIPDYDDSDNLRERANTQILKRIVKASTSPDICEVASDGSYIKVDTNPSDIKDYYNADYSQTVKDINKALGFSDSLWEKMGQTRALDGTLTDENDDFTVSWSYHPNKGMSVIYERR